jgi:hypothetical protein
MIRSWLGLRSPSQMGRHTSFRRRPHIELLEDRLAPAILWVTGTGDNIAVDGVVTLREAITSANNNANVNGDLVSFGAYGADTINFAIPGAGPHTITLTGVLPDINDSLTIDGYTQGDGTPDPATPNTLADGTDAVLKIIVSGNNRWVPSGLDILSTNTTIRGLVLNDFGEAAISVAVQGESANVRIQGNFIGTNATGTSNLEGARNIGNGQNGIFLGVNVSGVMIGGTNPADRNLISGNGYNGIHIEGVALAGPMPNVILGNLIGTNKAGNGSIPNGHNGIRIVDAEENTVGGVAAGSRNVISGNTQNGISIEGQHAFGNTIRLYAN